MNFLQKQLLLFFFLFSINVFSQEDTVVTNTLKFWDQKIEKNELGFDMTEIYFSNWNAGGTPSITGLFKGYFSRVFSKENTTLWTNEMIFKFGENILFSEDSNSNKTNSSWRKTDDMFQINSTFGYRQDTLSNWYHSAKFNFNTQFMPGYTYPSPNNPNLISAIFAPAYIFLGAGAEYNEKEKNQAFYFSPLTWRTTLVWDDALAAQGAFGVDKGKRSKNELGILTTLYFKKNIAENIKLENRTSLYTDYFKNFGNIRVDWDVQAEMTVNKYVRGNLGIHVLYDDNIKTQQNLGNGVQVTRGPKLQLKQVLGLGLKYNF